MTTKTLKHFSLALLATALLIGSTACSSGTAPSVETPSTESAAPQESTEDSEASNNRSGVITLTEASLQGVNGKARWEDETLIVALDGDVNEELEVSVACGILKNFLGAGEQASLEFPNGTVDCPGE